MGLPGLGRGGAAGSGLRATEAEIRRHPWSEGRGPASAQGKVEGAEMWGSKGCLFPQPQATLAETRDPDVQGRA